MDNKQQTSAAPLDDSQGDDDSSGQGQGQHHHDISSNSSQYETPAHEQQPPSISSKALKDRIRHHYEVCSDYYYSLW
jgi:hypothetical protein